MVLSAEARRATGNLGKLWASRKVTLKRRFKKKKKEELKLKT